MESAMDFAPRLSWGVGFAVTDASVDVGANPLAWGEIRSE